MSQQINFYNAKLVKPKDWFSLTTVAIVYAVSAGLMLFWYQQLNAEATLKEQARQVAQTQFEQAQKELTEAMSSGQNTVKQQDVEAQLKALQEQYESQEAVISAFSQVQGGTHAHIADYMAGLARQRLDNVWLTGFKMNAFSESLTLMGRAVKAELVPQYLNMLSHEPIFHGQLFGGLKLKEFVQATEQAAPSGSAETVQKTVTPATQKSISLIEFEVTGMDAKSKNSKQANPEQAGFVATEPALEKKKELANG